MNILAILAIWESVKKFNTGCKETLHFSPVTEIVEATVWPSLRMVMPRKNRGY